MCRMKKLHPYLHRQCINRPKNGTTKKGSVKKKTSFPARSCLLFICSYRCWKFNFLMQRAYMNAKNTAKSTSTGATTAMKLRWYPK